MSTTNVQPRMKPNGIRVQGKARVQLTIEIETSAWGADCTIGQVYEQAAEDGVNQLRKMIAESKCHATMIGQPRVIGVFTEKE